jgi:hypothetical protein
MKFSKIDANGVPSIPISLDGVIKMENLSIVTSRGLKELILGKGWKPVHPNTFPTPPENIMGRAKMKLSTPIVEEDGSLTRTYIFEEVDEQTRQKFVLGAQDRRIRMLNSTDWVTTSDNSLSPEKKQEFLEYRQKLRDIPEQDGYPVNLIWPKLPAKPTGED